MNEITVTVICLAYNHEAWIRDALDGFVSQEAPFGIEVLVHDDASTDGTADIIRDYAARYPDRIHPVLERENQFSRGIAIGPRLLAPLIHGRYVALCEGDDYWTDPHKLAKQVAALEAHPEADICAHRARRVNTAGTRSRGYVAPRLHDAVLSTDEIILGGGGRFVATASLLCRTEAYKQWTPMREVVVNDFVLQLQGAARGGMVYLSDCMSAYRTGVPGSWTHRHSGRRTAVRQTMKQMLDTFDTWTEGRFHEAVVRRKALYDSDDLVARHKWATMLSPHQLPVTLYQLRRSLARWGRNVILSLSVTTCRCPR